MKIHFLILTLMLWLQAVPAAAAEVLSDEEALALGRRVQAVKTALEHPERPEAQAVIRDLGNDSRYYVMVRGWVIQHLKMAESYLETTAYHEDPLRREEVDTRIAALKKALRAIDLE